MRVFVAGGTGHSGSYIIPELIAAGHEVTGLARSNTAAAALSALGAKVRRREIAEAIGRRLGLPAVSVPADELVLPGYSGFLANVVTQNYAASNLVTRRALGWEPAQPGLLADLDNGHYFPAD
ncbi:NAD-dependent epimerase/dehydratase family protein [Actinoplanes sp. LDG1-06]|uniref:NAD-dependent epimerase/dehydratase family protein n=1 Tax=Paractinoplanes ovalisporus TaxID=2810368 RepID=A0ABS2A502_9ACTN|nr:NAD-dependent epimerase/dehydratase family protein [Actinoplanes ovalisporus]MBM2614904.1 NAD-dependent epimerase/dehydratase family protein [Actinoplanes ovalisporus]